MKQVQISAKKREITGKGSSRSARRNGMVPGVIYGEKKEPFPIAVDRHDMEVALHSGGGGGESDNLIVNLNLENADDLELTLVRDTQHDPLTGFLEHVDFLRISRDRSITTMVTLQPVGTPAGIKNGGVFEQILREVEIECLPLDIPDAIEFDVSHMDVNDSYHVSDLPENPKYTILTDGDYTVASLTIPRMEIETPTVAEGLVEGEEGEAEEGAEETTEE